jgi:transposase InsO family protein
MPFKKHTPEEIMGKLREAEIVLAQGGVQTFYITPGSPWESGYCESFNGSLRDELLNGEMLSRLAEAQNLTV